MSTKAELALRSALLSTGMVQPIEASSKGGKVEALSRQIPGQEKAWLETLAQMLLTAEEHDIKVHMCRRYVIRNGQMVFGWHIEISAPSAKSLDAKLAPIIGILEEAKPQLSAPVRPQPPPPPVEPAPVRRPQAQGTTAHPRPPNPPAQVQQPPPNFSPTVRMVRNDIDENGKRHIIEEFPLPFVYNEMNRPNEKGRGAKKTAG